MCFVPQSKKKQTLNPNFNRGHVFQLVSSSRYNDYIFQNRPVYKEGGIKVLVYDLDTSLVVDPNGVKGQLKTNPN